VTEAAPDFHARKSARAKTYRYRMYRGAICPPFLARYVWHYPFPLEEVDMAMAAAVVVGEHDLLLSRRLIRSVQSASLSAKFLTRGNREGHGEDCRKQCSHDFFFRVDARR